MNNKDASDASREVRVKYVPRGYGIALTIFDEIDEAAERDEVEGDVNELESTEPEEDFGGTGVLTVIESGITTLELRSADGGSPSVLIWDQAEVDATSLRAS